jgi:hypothetical protein
LRIHPSLRVPPAPHVHAAALKGSRKRAQVTEEKPLLLPEKAALKEDEISLERTLCRGRRGSLSPDLRIPVNG